ncbi:MAG TPA: CoA-binding protein [Bacteroidota bacterium]|nr:CoA-binding protein [Bacteroidota bacterium]
MNELIEEFIECRHIAVVGFSRTGKKFGNAAFAELNARGFEVFAVHPTEKEIGGVPCFPNLSSLFGRIDGVLISVSPQKAIPALEEAASIGIKHIWL